MSEEGTGTVGCVIVILVLVVNVVLGTMAFGYCCETVFGKRPPVVASLVGGAVAGEVVMPAAVVLWSLNRAGVIHPPLVKP